MSLKILLVSAIAICVCVGSSAQQIVTEGGKAYRLHTVEKGEGLYRIGQTYGAEQEEIIAANPTLKTTGLKEGMVIRVPIKASEALREAQSETRPTKTYKVQQGETAYSVARKHDMSLTEFLQLNPQANSGVREGQEVKVYGSETIKNAEQSQTSEATVGYTVKKGDTMYSVAKAHGMTIPQFLALNPSSTAGLREGEVVKVRAQTALELYAMHTIGAGETLYSIGVKYGVKPQQILDANLMLDASALPIGTTIRIPTSRIPEEDDSFVYHRIAQGETLYSLSVRYDILQEKIRASNPGIDWGALQVGQVVAVPKHVKATKIVYKEHEVGRKETLFSIAQMYGIGVDELSEANGGLQALGLKKGMTLRIPQKVEVESVGPATADTAYIGNEVYRPNTREDYDYVAMGRPKIRVFLMLPFDAWNEVSNLRHSGVNTRVKPYEFKTRRYIEFYEGVRLALDSLSEAGANIELKVFDTNNRLDAVNQLTAETEKPDLIIGPAHQQEMPDILRYAEINRIPVVLPFAQADSTILGIPYAFQASYMDSINSRVIDERIAREAAAADKIILISPRGKSAVDKKRTERIKAECLKMGKTLTEHDYNPQKSSDFMALIGGSQKPKVMPETKMSVAIILPTNNEARVSSVLTSMSSAIESRPDVDVRLYAGSPWLSFHAIEPEVFHKLNTHIYSTFGIDYTSAKVRHTLEKYRRAYSSEPVAFMPYFQQLKSLSGFSEFGLWGYDVAMKFVSMRISKGPNFFRSINTQAPHSTQTNFKFKTLSNWGGSVNVGLKVITFGTDGSTSVSNLD